MTAILFSNISLVGTGNNLGVTDYGKKESFR